MVVEAGTKKVDKSQAHVMCIMTKRVDRLMKAIQNEVNDGDFRFEVVTDLIAIRRKFAERNTNE